MKITHNAWECRCHKKTRSAPVCPRCSGLSVRVGDRVRFDTHSNLGVREDTVQGLFIQTIHLQPYAPNELVPAIILTEHSWTSVSSILEVIG